jgi:hypothetical protein
MFGKSKEAFDNLKDNIAGKGKGNVNAQIIPDQFNDVWQEVNNQHDMGFGRTPEETWANNAETAEEMKEWRKRFNAEKAKNGEEDKPFPW